MPVTGVSVEGLRELQAALRAAGGPGLVRLLTVANKNAATVVVTRARPEVPTLTGRLASSVRATGTQRKGVARAGSARVPYAAAIHWGRKIGNVGRPPGNRYGFNPIAGRPFLTSALESSWPQVVRQYNNEIDALVAKINGAAP